MYNNIDITWSVQFAHVISGTESLYPNKCIGWGTERELDCLDLSVGSLHLYDFIALPIHRKDICMIINLGWGA